MIRHRSIGSGSVALILHGFAGSSAEMEDLAARLPGRKLLVDLPGHGATGSDVAGFDMRSTVAELIRLLDAEQTGRVDVVGYSMGGRVALALAAWHPDRVRSAVAIGGRTGMAPDQRQDRIESDARLADTIERNGAEWFARDWVSRSLYDTQRRLGDEHMASVVRSRSAVDPEGVARSLREMGSGAQPDVTRELAAASVPVALLVGGHDPKFHEIAHHIAAAVASASVVVIPEAGHATHVEAPEATAGAIVSFWESL